MQTRGGLVSTCQVGGRLSSPRRLGLAIALCLASIWASSGGTLPASRLDTAPMRSIERASTLRPLFASTLERAVYVATSGADGNAGTADQPLRTIGEAARRATAGTVVHVAPGTYNEAVVTNTSGTAGGRIHYVSDARWGAHVASTGAEHVWRNRGNYVTIEGFDITSPDARIGIGNDPNVGYVAIVANRVHDLPGPPCAAKGGAGILHDYWSGGHDSDTLGNLVERVGASQGCATVHGIYHSTAGGRIQNNIVHNSAGWGIHFWHAARGVTVSNNLVFGNRGGGITVGAGDAPGGVIADEFVVANNIVRNNPIGILEFETSGSHQLGGNNAYLNNLVFQNQTDVRLVRGRQDGTIQTDPLMVAFRLDGRGDYHLRLGSPAIAAATSRGAPAVDFEDTTRPQGGGFDVGPYELPQSGG
jgi:parallel beta-helix repeat protein